MRSNKQKINKNFIGKKINKYFFNNFNTTSPNFIIMLLSVFIGVLGLFILLSATSYLTIKYNLSRYHYFIRQGIYLIVGIFLMFLISKIDYKLYHKYAYIFYIASIFLLLMIFVPGLSSRIKGARRILNIGISFMPSDIVKISTILCLSRFMIDNKKYYNNFFKSVLPTGLLILLPIGLIMLQPDLSTSIVIIVTLAIVYLVNGFNYKFFLPIFLVGIALVIFAATNLKGYQLDRITAFLNPEEHYEHLSWQVLNGLFAISRGGLFGVGYGKSIYKQGYLADEVSNDMIFSVFGEEFGFIGSVLFIILVITIALLIFNEAIKSKNKFAKSVCFGIGTLYLLQSLINIGVSLSLIPNTGITLPFVSNGGTSLIVFYIMFGIVLNISRENNYIKNENKK